MHDSRNSSLLKVPIGNNTSTSKGTRIRENKVDIPAFWHFKHRPHMKRIESAEDNKLKKETATSSKKTSQK
jgi:hypothetical protein